MLGPKSCAAVVFLALLLWGAWPAARALAGEPQCEPQKVATKYPSLAGKTVKVSINADSKPSAYRDPNNLDHLIGFSVDQARETFACIGVPFEFAVAPFSGLLPSVSSGQTDVVWGMIYYTPERAKAIDFILFMRGASGGVVLKDNPKNIRSLDDLCGKRAVAPVGSLEILKLNETNAACTTAHKPEIAITATPSRPEGLRLLDSDRVDLYLGIGLVQGYDPTLYKMAFIYTSDIQVGVGVGKGKKELAQAIHDAFLAIRASGMERKIYESYEMDPGWAIAPDILVE